jgi:hypothetical protein
MSGRRIATVLGAAASALALSACGSGEHATYADNLGPGYVQVGQLNYQIQLSRELNPFNQEEDHWYLQGFSKSQLKLSPLDEFFGVSLQVFNWTHTAATPTDSFFISDTLGDKFVPMTNPNPNAYTYVPQSIPAGGQYPAITSNAYSTWSGGEFLIFKIPYADLPNRPFVLHIVNAQDPSRQSQIELDV